MSLGSIIGGVVGGVVGFFIGGPTGAYYGAVLGFGIGMAIDPMTPDIPNLGTPNPDENVMKSEIGVPVPDLIGTAKITGHLLCFGNERNQAVYAQSTGGGKGGGGGGDAQVSGYRYYMSWALGFCACPGDSKINTLYAIYKNDDAEPVWPGPDIDSFAWAGIDCPVSGGHETIVIDGIGSIDFYFGTNDQVVNTGVAEIIEDPTLNTPYRNMCWAFFDDCYIGEYNRAPTYKFIMKKIPEYSFNDEDSTIETFDVNPANAMYYILSNLSGLPTSWLDSDDFETITGTLFGELRGICVLLDKQQSVLSYLESINSHVDNIIRYGSDAKFHPKLIRDDYNVGSLPTINESVMLEDPSFSRGSWIDTMNEIKVQYSELIGRNVYLFGSGRNNIGQLGIGATPVNTAGFISINDDGDTFIDAACGSSFSVILKSDGTLWSTGYNVQGQLGLGHKTSPILEWTQIGTGTDWIAVTCGNRQTYALKSDGTIWCCGEDRYGELGQDNDTGAGTYTYYDELVQMGSETDWESFDSMQHAFFAINTSGELHACGYNVYYNLGLNDTTNRGLLTRVGTDTDWSKGIPATYASIGLKTDGTLWTWGGAFQGFLGNGTTTPNIQIPTKIGTDTDWAYIGNTAYCSYAIKTSGELYGSGYNSEYELGLNHQNQVNTFTQIGTDTDWEKVFGNWSLMIAVKTNGRAYGAGYTWEDVLGVGESIDNYEHEFIAIADTVFGVNDAWEKFSTWGNNHYIGIIQ